MACNFAALPELKGEEQMTNDEARMTKEAPSPNDKPALGNPMIDWSCSGRSSFGHYFVIGISSLVIIVLSTLSLLWCGCAGPHNASPRPASPHIVGRISGNFYTSPQGHFSVPFPVMPELGGCVSRDDAQSVTFHDDRGGKISFYSRSFNARSPLMSVPQSEARAKALETFMKDIYGDLIVPHYHPDILQGTISFIYLKPVGPKIGVATFIHQQRVYLVETDLLPGVEFLSKKDDASEQANDQWLENHAVELLRSIEIK
jgi:hypothetical protein